ncbi:MAG: exodeoxyribonuclease VII large subunit [Deltaproteobacteria bacterium]|nr:exodeoxyribonuclease VII large subunit [Deltaproteobacteria bacterium]MBT7712225.1 exodeoxyribonuclease VII large subunit [Deltaproteobacteria bacterium]
MPPKALTITELTRGIKHLLEGNLGRVFLQGEISNLARPNSGHLYFNVKDDNAQIAGVMFRSVAQRTRFALENGLEILLHGRITVYEPRGVYQLIVDRVEPLGAGAFQLAFEQMKSRLSAEGLFDPEYKQPLPFLPRGIGVVTSPSGAAIRDILNVLGRRFPSIPILINPVSVQGDVAAKEIASAIGHFQGMENIDLLIVGRGGGSVEDLWSFNEEVVARAIFKSKIPIISAVGHETDFTIADFVADLRAPTPSAAAELAVPLLSDLTDRVGNVGRRLISSLQQQLQVHGEALNYYQKRLRSPQWVIQRHMQRVDELNGRLSNLIYNQLQGADNRQESLYQQLRHHSPLPRIEQSQIRIKDLKRQLLSQSSLILERNRNRLQAQTQLLNSASPLSIMDRGYAMVTDSENRPLTSVKAVKVNSPFSVLVPDGLIRGRVETVVPSPPRGSKPKSEP